jgi:hypothetical protein
MKRKHWLIFGVVQAIGVMSGFAGALLQDPLFLGISFSFLSPGSLAAFALSKPGYVGADWSLWKLGAIAVVANVLLFTIASFLLARFRRSN